jgi:uncharacterized protein YkwD
MLLSLMLASAALADPVSTQALNDYRASFGLPPLSYSESLEKAATGHALDMARKGFFDHQGSDGSSVAQRVQRVGYGWCFVAENIAMGQESLSRVMADWAASDGHRRNMLDKRAREFALVEGPQRNWVMVLAAPGC